MPKKSYNLDEFVIVDLETIGLDKESGRILEIAALLVRDWEVVEVFDRLIDPGMKVPRVTTALTGIRNSDVAGQPPIEEVLPGFLDFAGGSLLLGHNLISFDKPYLEYHLSRLGLKSIADNPALDTLELALFLLPHWRRHKLDHLYSELVSRGRKQKHRAADDCRMTLEVLKALEKTRDQEWDGRWLDHAGAIAKQCGWGWADFILGRKKGGLELGKPIVSFLPFENFLDGIKWEALERIEETESGEPGSDEKREIKEEIKITDEEIAGVFSGTGKGSLKSALGAAYEPRREQEALSKRIAKSINEKNHLAAEAPTGSGKSLAYLVPAAIWSLKNNNRPIIISTYTNALQDQLYESDYKIINEIFSGKVSLTVAKGREHYLCLRRFKEFLQELETEEQSLLGASDRIPSRLYAVFAANWAIKSQGNFGDLDRFPFWLRSRRESIGTVRFNSTRDTCQGRFCEFYDRCFVNRLKIATRQSNIVVSNHSLVFSDPWDNHAVFSVLPHDFGALVIDEAINIEDAATGASTASFSKSGFERELDEFFDISRPKKGALRRVEIFLEKTGDISLLDKVPKIKDALRDLGENAAVLFGLVRFEADGRNLEYDDRAEIFPDLLRRLSAPLQNIAVLLNQVIAFLDSVREQHFSGSRDSLAREIRNLVDGFGEYRNFLAVLFELNKNEYIFFRVISARFDDASLNFCRKDVGKFLAESLYAKAPGAIIFLSATLTYSGKFDFVYKIWGLNYFPKDRIAFARLPYLFDYARQCALVLVADLPNREREGGADTSFYPLVSDWLKRLIVANHGSALMLFTNKKDAARFGDLIVEELEENEIPLYSTEKSQDLRIMSGGKSGIVDEFRQNVESCLIGTAGLREGINVPGESLELVVIVKLPFAVPSDPILQNRQLVYGGFSGYALPQCLFAVKQAFGRLIRSRDDQGFVFIVDARVRKYLGELKDNLPENLNIIGLQEADFGRFNALLTKYKGVKNRVEKINDQFK